MKFLKLALTLAMLIAAATYTTAQVVRQSTSAVNKAKSSSSVEKDTTAPEYYELRCRGGASSASLSDSGSLQGSFQGSQLQFWITEGTPNHNERIMNMWVNFIPGNQAVNVTGSNLEFGQCSWLDRGIRPGEPFQIRQEIVYFGQLKQLQSRIPIDNTPTSAERYPDSQNVPEYLQDPNHYWSFIVRYVPQDVTGGYFEALSSHYWKPPISDVRKAASDAKVTVPTTDSQKATATGANPQIKRVPPEQQKKIIRKPPNQN